MGYGKLKIQILKSFLPGFYQVLGSPPHNLKIDQNDNNNNNNNNDNNNKSLLALPYLDGSSFFNHVNPKVNPF